MVRTFMGVVRYMPVEDMPGVYTHQRVPAIVPAAIKLCPVNRALTPPMAIGGVNALFTAHSLIAAGTIAGTRWCVYTPGISSTGIYRTTPMNVRTICLAILYDDDSTGYEIRKLSTEGEYSYFIDASFGAIYPALAKLEDDKLVTSRVEQQDGKPAKKVYSITALGRHEFINSLFEQLGEDEYRSEFLLFARFASELARSLVQVRLKE